MKKFLSFLFVLTMLLPVALLAIVPVSAAAPALPASGAITAPWVMVDDSDYGAVKAYNADGSSVNSKEMFEAGINDAMNGHFKFFMGETQGHLINSTATAFNGQAGAYVEFTFRGTGVALLSQFHNFKAQCANLEFLIDGKSVGTLSGSSYGCDTMDGSHIVRKVYYQNNNLPDGLHTFTVKATSGGFTSIDAFAYVPSSAGESWVTVDDSQADMVKAYNADGSFVDSDYHFMMGKNDALDVNLQYKFFMGDTVGHLYNNTSTTFNNLPGSYVEFTFSGTGVALFSQFHDNKALCANLEFFIDGKSAGTLDANQYGVNTFAHGEHTVRKVYFLTAGLPDGQHVLRVKTTSVGQASIDGFSYLPSCAGSAWTMVDDSNTAMVGAYNADGSKVDSAAIFKAGKNDALAPGNQFKFFMGSSVGHLINSTSTTFTGISTGCHVTFTFNGTGVAVLSQFHDKKELCANLAFYIDGKLAGTLAADKYGVNTFAHNEHTNRKAYFQITGLKGGQHVLKVVATTRGQASFDAFAYLPCNHQSTKWLTTKPATPFETGTKKQYCTICDTLLKTETIAMTKETYGYASANKLIVDLPQSITPTMLTTHYNNMGLSVTIQNAQTYVGTGSKLSFGSDVHTVMMKGDTNGSGTIDFSDVTSSLNHLTGKETLNGVYKTAGLFKGTSEISIFDIFALYDSLTPTTVTVFENGTSPYSIVYPNGNEGAQAAATILSDSIKNKFGSALPIVTDNAQSASVKTELLIGKTNRQESTSALSGLAANSFVIQAVNNKIVIAGSSDLMVCYAVSYFVDNYVNPSNVQITLPADLNVKTDASSLLPKTNSDGSVTVKLNRFVITYNDSSKYTFTPAVAKLFAEKAEEKHPAVFINEDATVNTLEILFGDCSRTQYTEMNKTYLFRDFSLYYKDGKISVSALSIYGYERAMRFLLENYNKDLTIPAGGLYSEYDYGTGEYAQMYKNYENPHISGTKMVSIAHRGDVTTGLPENSLPSYQACLNNKIDVIETDLRLTDHGVWVILHDNAVNRTTNGTGEIFGMTLSQIKSLQLREGNGNGTALTNERIPTLVEIIRLCRGKALFNLDKLSLSLFQSVYDVFEAENATDMAMFKSDITAAQLTAWFVDLMRQDRALPLYSPMNYGGSFDNSLRQFRGLTSMIETGAGHNATTVALANECHIRLMTTTVNNPSIDTVENWTTIKQKGYTGIMTDQPEKLYNFIHGN